MKGYWQDKHIDVSLIFSNILDILKTLVSLCIKIFFGLFQYDDL